MDKDTRISQLEDEVCKLRAELERAQGGADGELWGRAFDTLPDGSVFHSVRNMLTDELVFKRVSSTWKEMMGVSAEDTLANSDNIMSRVHPEDLPNLLKAMNEAATEAKKLEVKFRYLHPEKEGEEYWLELTSYPLLQDNRVVADGFLFDVTELKLAEQKLFSEKIRLEKMSNNIPDSVLYRVVSETETGNTFLDYAGSNWTKVVGTPASVFEKELDLFHELIHPDDRERVRAANINSFKTLTDFNVEFRFPVNGETRWLLLSSKLYRKGNIVYADGICMNITARKEAEIELEIEKERLQNLGDNIPYGTVYRYVYDTETKRHSIEYVSAGWEKTMGYSAELALNDLDKAFSHVFPEDLPRLLQSVEDSIKTMTTFDVEYRLVIDGVVRWVRKSAHPRRDGKLIIWDGLGIDITERKVAQAKLKFEKERLQMMGDNIPNGALFQFTLDAETGKYSFEYVSARWEEVMGFSAESALNDKVNSFAYIHPDDLPMVKNALEESVKTLQPFDTEHRNVIDGRVYWVHLSSYARRENGHIIWDGIAISTTSRKEAELRLEQEKERLKTLGDNIPNGVLFQYSFNLKTDVFSFDYVSAQWEEVMGFSANFALDDKNNSYAYVHPDDLPTLQQKLKHTIETLEPFSYEHRNIGDDGKVRWVDMSCHARREGDIVVLDGIAINTTRRKEAEMRSELEKGRLETLGNNIPNGSLYQFVLDKKTGRFSYSYVGSKWIDVVGCSSDDFLHYLENDIERDHPILSAVSYSAETLTVFDYELHFDYRGSVRWLRFSSQPQRDGDNIIWDGIALNITARKEAEQKLLQETNRLEALGSNLPDVAIYQFVFNTETENMYYSYVSGTWEKITGVPAHVAMSDAKEVMNTIHPDDLPRWKEALDHAITTLSNFYVEVRTIIDGRIRWRQMSSRLHRKGKLVIADGTMLDITHRKEAELKLKLEHDRLEALGNNLPNVVLYQFVSNKKTNLWQLTYVSKTWESVIGVPEKVAISDINKVLAAVHPDDLPQLIQAINNSTETLENFYSETRFIVRGAARWMQLTSRLQVEGDFTVSNGIIMDITYRKEAELKLELEHNRLESLGANLPDVALYQFISDTQSNQWHFSYVSGSWESVTGVPADVALNDINAVFNMVHPDDLEPLMQAIKISREGMGNFSHEVRLIVHGKKRWVHLSSRHRRDGVLIISDGIIMDITNRKKAERELEYERNRLQTLGDNLPGGCLFQFVRDIRTGQMRFSYVSASWTEVTGVPATQAMTSVKQLFAAMQPDELPPFIRAIDESARAMTDFDVVFRTKERWLHIVSRPRMEEKMIVWDGIVMDITAEKTAEIALAESERKHRFIFDNTKEMFWIADVKTFKMTFVGGAAFDIYEMTSEEIVQKNLFDFFEEQTAKNFAELIKEAEEIYKSEGIIKNILFVEKQYRKDGTGIWIETSAQLAVDENGKVTQIVGIDRNIDERVKTENELAKYREKLELMVQERTEELQKAVNELAAIGEELFSANKELECANEELHTTNEQMELASSDLRAANEELLSATEELVSTNEELQMKNDQLATVMKEHEQLLKELDNLRKMKG